MKAIKTLVPFALFFSLVALMMLPARQADAQLVPLELAQGLAAVPGPLSVLKTFTVAVDKNPDGGTDLIQSASTDRYTEVSCENRSTSAVYVGNHTDDLDSKGKRICADSAVCERWSATYSVQNGQLGADLLDSDFPDGGTVTLYCEYGR